MTGPSETAARCQPCPSEKTHIYNIQSYIMVVTSSVLRLYSETTRRCNYVPVRVAGRWFGATADEEIAEM